jgi:hypothetical protein
MAILELLTQPLDETRHTLCDGASLHLSSFPGLTVSLISIDILRRVFKPRLVATQVLPRQNHKFIMNISKKIAI